MATRRMFTKTITNSSEFLMMPPTAQLLYVHFGMNADDDGFCEIFPIMRMTDSKPDDLSVLQARRFVKIFDDKVLIITAWKDHNYIRQDTYSPSKYLKIYKNEIKLLAKESQEPRPRLVDGSLTQDRIGKDRIDTTTVVVGKNPPPPKQDYKIIDNFLKEIQDILGLTKWADTQRWTRVYAQKCLKEHGRDKTLEAIKWIKLNWNSKPTKMKTIFYGIREYEERIKPIKAIDLSHLN